MKQQLTFSYRFGGGGVDENARIEHNFPFLYIVLRREQFDIRWFLPAFFGQLKLAWCSLAAARCRLWSCMI
jgi:hypothetical protein